MKETRLKRVMFVLALMGTSLAAFNAVRAEEDASQTEIIESMDEVYESESEESEVIEENEEVLVTESEISEVTETSEDIFEEVEETLEAVETEAFEAEPEETEACYDVPSSVINGWYVPSFNYNDNGTITYFLPDGTPFYNVEMNELVLPQYAWAYTGLRGYVDYQYGSVNYLTDEELSSFELAADSILSGQEG